MVKESRSLAAFLESLSVSVTRATGSSLGLGIAVALVFGWLLLGPPLHFSQKWQNLLSMGISIATFLMLFLLQRAQSKDMLALHLKLNELIASQSGASNRMLNIEHLTESELGVLKELHGQLPKNSLDTHSVEDVREREPEILIAER